MTFPVWISIGSWRLHPHTVFEVLAYASGFALYLALRRRRGDAIGDAHRWSVLTATIIGAAIGSRLLAWFESPTPDGVIDAFGGKTIVGGLLGGWIGTELQKSRRGIRQSTGDLYVYPLTAGIAIGRIGCFLTGLPDRTYGVATGLPWGVDLGDGVSRHPTAIYESLFVLAVGLGLTRVERRLAPGQLFRMFTFGYLAFRVVVDAIKPGSPIALGLTAIQWASLVGALYSAWLLSRKEADVAVRGTS